MSNGDLDVIGAALVEDARQCRYHGDDFTRAGTWGGVPRCESCRQPWRVVAALAALERLREALSASAAAPREVEAA